jgi:hypothetical protein
MKETQTEKCVDLIIKEEKGKVGFSPLDDEEGTQNYYNDVINVFDDVESGKIATWKETKNFMSDLYSKSNSMFFISHKEDEIVGKPQLIMDTQRLVVLCSKFQKDLIKKDRWGAEDIRTITQYKFLDDNFDRRDIGKETENISYWFWVYRIIENGREYILFSQKKLSPELYRFRGMKIILKDNSEISKTLRFNSLTKVFISVEEDKAIKSLDKPDLIEHIKRLKDRYQLNQENFREYLFTNKNGKIYNHTENYAKVMLSFLLSGKYEDYPLHLIVFGPAGTGKTTELECLQNVYDEEKGIFEAGNSTLKGLIPSFREKPARVGYVLDCLRVGFVDELFKMVEKSETGRDKEYLQNYLSQLNMLLEHKDRTIGSGCDTIRAKATAKLLFMTNPYRKEHSIYEHIGLIDITTLSRFIPFVQDYEERNLILKKQIRVNENNRMTKEEFLTISDSCQSFLIDYDEEKVKAIYNNLLVLIKEPMKEVWKARGLHHSILLLDGLVKLRCLFEEDVNFKAMPQDYDELERVILYIIKSWDCGLRDWEKGDQF